MKRHTYVDRPGSVPPNTGIGGPLGGPKTLLKPGRKKKDRAPFYKPGYEPGKIGLDLEILLAAHQATILTKVNALQKKGPWAAHYKEKSKFEALRSALLEKARY